MNAILITKTNTGYQADTKDDGKTINIFQTDNINQLLGYIAAKMENLDVL